MSIAVFDYSSMRCAAEKARKAGTHMSDYGNELNRKVSRKLADYDGDANTWNVSQAGSLTVRKVQQLNERASQLQTYGNKVDALVTKCEDADRAVADKVTQLTGDFKTRHNIKINAVYEGLVRLTVDLGNRDAAGRLASDLLGSFGDKTKELGDRLKEWYTYGGGKYIIWENTKAALSIAAGAVAIVAAVATGGAAIVVLAGVIAGSMAVINGAVNLVNNSRAGAAAEDDPVRAKRMGDTETLADALRKSDNKAVHWFADSIDAVETLAKVITLASGIKDVVNNGIKWLKAGNPLGNGSTSGSLGAGASARWTNFKNRMGDFLEDTSHGQWASAQKTASSYAEKFLKNVLKPFKEANAGLRGTDLKEGVDGLKFYTSLSSDLAEDGFGKTFFKNCLPGVALGKGDDAFTLGDIVEHGGNIIDSVKDIGGILENIVGGKAGMATRSVFA